MKLTIADNDLRKVTRMCDLGHIRVRYPLLDEKVVQLGFSIPSRLKVKGQKGLRYIFKRAFKNFLPQEILQKKKHGFGLPISEWLRADSKIQKVAYNLLKDAHHIQRGYFRQDFIKNLWQSQLNDTTPYYGTSHGKCSCWKRGIGCIARENPC
jgi:asparagine synthase (glutamine-hydrolysing)